MPCGPRKKPLESGVNPDCNYVRVMLRWSNSKQFIYFTSHVFNNNNFAASVTSAEVCKFLSK